MYVYGGGGCLDGIVLIVFINYRFDCLFIFVIILTYVLIYSHPGILTFTFCHFMLTFYVHNCRQVDMKYSLNSGACNK